MIEKKRGVFYFKSRSFLHFHEDPAGIFADVKVDGDWTRRPIASEAAKRKLLADVRRYMA